jgi:hypothetical protein
MECENAPQTWWGTAGNNNPLNNGQGSGGGAGLGSYGSLDDAAFLVADLLMKNAPFFGWNRIKDALLSNAPTSKLSEAVVYSHWAESHYGVKDAGAPLQHIVPGRRADFLAARPVPQEVTADISRGTNKFGCDGAGWSYKNAEEKTFEKVHTAVHVKQKG